MTDQLHDDEFEEVFHRARARDTAWTPSFERVMARRPAVRRRPWVLAIGAVAAVGLVAVGVVRSRPRRTVEAPFTITVGSLRMPTDFLLDIAGAETLSKVPSFGRADDWFPNISGAKGDPL